MRYPGAVQCLLYRAGDGGGQRRRHCIANLPGDFHLAAGKREIIREAHDARGLAVGNGAVLFRMQVTAFFRFEEFGADGGAGG